MSNYEPVKYHITDKGSEECGASVRQCPYAEKGIILEHFDTKDEADKAFKEHMELLHGAVPSVSRPPEGRILSTDARDAFGRSNRLVPSNSSGSVVPPVPNHDPLLRNEAEELLARAHKKVAEGNLVGYGLIGSSFYNLDTPESDRDVILFTNSKAPDYHKVFDDGADVRVSSLFSFADRIHQSQPSEVDLLMSNTIRYDNSPYEAYIRSLRFNTTEYLDRSESHSVRDIKNALKDADRNQKRSRKALKTAFRNAVMMNRVMRDGTGYTSRFTNSERARFYESLPFFYDSTEDDEHKIFERMLRSAKRIG
jgi:hypothetical protein